MSDTTIMPMWLILHVRRPIPLAWDVFRGPAVEPIWARVTIAEGPRPLTDHAGISRPAGDYDTELVKWEGENDESIRASISTMEAVMTQTGLRFRFDGFVEAMAREATWRKVPCHIRFVPMVSHSALAIRGDTCQEPD